MERHDEKYFDEVAEVAATIDRDAVERMAKAFFTKSLCTFYPQVVSLLILLIAARYRLCRSDLLNYIPDIGNGKDG